VINIDKYLFGMDNDLERHPKPVTPAKAGVQDLIRKLDSGSSPE
jgi:hypothetical protein